MRIDRLRKAMAAKGVHAVLVTADVNVRYYSRFTGDSSQLLITADRQFLFTDFRYREQAEAETAFHVVETKGATRIPALFEYAKQEGVVKLGIDLETVSYKAYKVYMDYIDDGDIVDMTADISAQRSVKDADELDAIAKGAMHNDMLFRHICGMIRPGVSENDIKAEIIYYMNRHGADSAFAPIVASGPHSSLPHATPTDRRFAPGEFVTMDYGCVFDGYCSDFTRTVAISHIDKEMQKVYDIVKQAGDAAIAVMRPGMAAKDADAVARNIIAEAGYADAFGHGLGHGVGLFIHEAPRLGEGSSDTLKDGMVVTVEPGIYLEGRFGVRIEDLCVINQGGCTDLTSAPRDIIII